MKDEQLQASTKEIVVEAEKERKRKLTIAVCLMLMSGLGFAMMTIFIRFSGDLSAVQKSFFRNLFAFFISIFMFSKAKKKKPLSMPHKKDYKWLFLRAALGTLGVVANFFVIDHLAVANAAVLNKLSPFFTIIFSALFLKEKVNKGQIIGIIFAFLGVIFLVKPFGVEMTSSMALVATLIGMGGGVAAGGAYTCVHYLSEKGVSSSLIICFFSGFSCVVLFPFILFQYQAMSVKQWIFVALIGVGAVIGQYGITFAYRLAKPNQISIFDYSMVVFTAIFGIVALHETPDLWSILGMVIIFGAFLTMFIFNRRLAMKNTKD